MYLADREIRALLNELKIVADNPDHPFNEDEQIQPASIDLRLDTVFWRQRARKVTDLRRAKLLTMAPRRHWKKEILAPGESISCKPGEMILGRTYEEFTIPPTYAGKLEGRSSYARMGLAVHCSADFINPGYRGRMPLQLVNHSRNPIRLVPYYHICQLMIVRMSSEPERPYGTQGLYSKYMNDDGGPSYWWDDNRLANLHARLREHDINEKLQHEILELVGPTDPDVVERFEKVVQRTDLRHLNNATDILDRFAKSEDHARVRAQIIRGTMIASCPFLLSASIGSLFELGVFGGKPYGVLHYLIWILTVVSVPVSIIGTYIDTGVYLGQKTLWAVLLKRGKGEVES
jgi:deoxycytidine triphosphate deaminase